MWLIRTLTNDNPQVTQAYYAMGSDIHAQLSDDSNVRLMLNPIACLDFRELTVDRGAKTLYINASNNLPYTGDANVDLTINADNTFTARVDATYVNGSSSQDLKGPLELLGGISAEDVANFNAMLNMGLIPYRQIPAPGVPKSGSEISALADQFFPNNPYKYEMAYSIYDWTTANFFRFLTFTEMAYTSIPGNPLDLASIQSMIWEHYYAPSYFAEDANFMNMFGLKAAQNEAQVASQLTAAVAAKLQPLVASELNILKYAVLNLPRISTSTYPQLFRGAMPLNTRPGFSSAKRFGASMMEFKGNSGPVGQPLEVALETAKAELFANGAYITPKACWSFTNTYNDAINYQNGIIVTVNPPAGYEYWPSGASILPFSVNPGAVEFNFPTRTRYQIEDTGWVTVNGQKLLSIEATLLGTFG